MPRKILTSVVLGGISLALFLLISGFNHLLEKGVQRSPLKALNNEINDIAFQDRFYTGQDSLLSLDDIVIVDIDEESIKELGRVQLWPRLYEAQVIKYLASSGVKSIVLDALYTEPDTLSEVYNKLLENAGFKNTEAILKALSTDKILAQEIKTAKNVYLPLFDDRQAPNERLKWLDETARTFVADSAMIDSYLAVENPALPIKQLGMGAKNLGTITLPSQSDGIIRYYPVLQKLDKIDDSGRYSLIGNISFQLTGDFLGINTNCLKITQHQISLCDKITIPTEDRGFFRINWLGQKESFRTISFHKVLSQKVPGAFFENKFVFIGASAAGLEDNKTTPLSQKVPGVQVHATAFLNMINKSFLKEWNFGALFPVFVIMAVLFNLIFISVTPLFSSIIFVGLALMEMFAYWLVIFDKYALILPVGSFLILTLVTFIVGVIYRYINEERQKKMLKGAFSSYVEPELVDQIVENHRQLKLGGQKKELTVLFSDIRGFTTFSESMDPEELVAFLNDYLDHMSEIIFRRQGTIDKFIGDAIMAIYGAPVSREDIATPACLTALEMCRELENISLENGGSGSAVNIGIGINTGEMTVGNIGSKRRFDYTVIGDSVNLAARLEGLNKYFGTRILISEYTLSKADKNKFIYREIANVAVKGKKKPVKVFQIMDRDTKNPVTLDRFLSLYQNGLTLYNQQQFSKAAEKWSQALEIAPDDKPTSIYLQRCNQFRENPSEFDPVFKMDVK